MTVPPKSQQEFYDTLMESQWWLEDRIRDYQRLHIEQLVRHAAANTTFYEDRLGTLFGRGGEIDWSRWLDVPTVRRQDLVSRRIAMHARVLPEGHAPLGVEMSSGSTGIAISVTTSALANKANNAARWRAHRRFDVDWSKSLCSRQETVESKAPWPDGRRVGAFGPPWIVGATGTAWMIYKGTSAKKTFEFIVRNECAYLAVGAKTAHALALEAERLGSAPHIRAILAQGEGCDDEDREACERVFSARVMEHYSSKEMGQAAHPCELGVLHVNEELVLLEILDDNGQPCPPGVTGRVVVTPFYSAAQPLIRYEQNDLATFGTRCACGRASRTIAKVVGRISTIFRHPDGRAVSRLLPGPAKQALHCTLMQIAQVGPTAFEIRYVPETPDSQPDVEVVRAVFRQEYFEDAEIDFVRMDNIPPGPSGKLIQYANEYQDRARSATKPDG